MQQHTAAAETKEMHKAPLTSTAVDEPRGLSGMGGHKGQEGGREPSRQANNSCLHFQTDTKSSTKPTILLQQAAHAAAAGCTSTQA